MAAGFNENGNIFTANGHTDASYKPPLRGGPPTREELNAYYPPKFTWEQLKIFICSGDLGLLKRDRALQRRYDSWAGDIRAKHGSMVNYLLNVRLRWGKHDTQAALPSALYKPADYDGEGEVVTGNAPQLPALPPDAPKYFVADISPRLISIIQNDWPYSVPSEIEHTLIWTRVPILPEPDLIPDHVMSTLPGSLIPRLRARLAQDGLWGFTGLARHPLSPSSRDDGVDVDLANLKVVPRPTEEQLRSAMGALAEWGKSVDTLVRSEPGTPEEEEAVFAAGEEVAKYVSRRWDEAEWETAWFVNPPRLQSVKGLAHIHIFARKKGPREVDEWNLKHRAPN